LIRVANHFGEQAPAAPVVNDLTAEHLQNWLTEAIQADDGSPTFRQGIGVLEVLLRAVLPEQTALLPNYPNPFNPETWIPYELSEAANVAIMIYNSVGKTVQTLDLGHQAAGVYRSKSRSTYWDGRNNLGERVGSGVYFYRLQAGSFSAMRKLVILK